MTRGVARLAAPLRAFWYRRFVIPWPLVVAYVALLVLVLVAAWSLGGGADLHYELEGGR